uniref:Cytochrome P450 n=1 Tax=Oryza meridionalis TaxID=40149 RepID=A0A0E0ESN5_9ORYZ
MELHPWPSLLVIVLAAVVFFLATILRHGRRAYRLPPGPKPWPIIGNLNLIGYGPRPQPQPYWLRPATSTSTSIHELSKRYGPLIQLRFGSCREEERRRGRRTTPERVGLRPSIADGKRAA